MPSNIPSKLLSLLCALALSLSLLTPCALAEDAHMSNFTATATYRNTFSDVSSAAWYAPSVKTCYEYGLMQGTYGKFNPGGSLTLAEALTLAVRVHCIYQTGSCALKNGAPWYQPYVDYAVANNMIDDDDFSDYTAVATRAQVAYLFARALPAAQLHALNSVTALNDVQRDKYYNSILLLYNAGVLTGTDPAGTFRPEDTIKRAEAAALISRVAIPANRKTFTLYDAHDLSAVVPGLTVYLNCAAPVADAADTGADTSGGVPGSADTGSVTDNDTTSVAPQLPLIAEGGVYLCTAFPIGSVSNASVTQRGQTVARNDLINAMAKRGYTVTADSVTAAAVSFGTTAAYRYQFKLTDASSFGAIFGFGYVFVENGREYAVIYLTRRDSTEFRTVAGDLILNSAAVSPRI